MAVPTRTPSQPVEGTIVFTDIVGFTEFTATRGDAEALQLLATQDRLVHSALPRRHVSSRSWATACCSGFPIRSPLCTAPSRSTAASKRSRQPSGLPLWIRVGMHHGTALPRGADVIGHDVNVAARIVEVAAPGEVLVSDTVRAAVDPRSAHVCFNELGPVVMKGIPGPIRLWRATAC